jgi:hypothetical protein
MHGVVLRKREIFLRQSLTDEQGGYCLFAVYDVDAIMPYLHERVVEMAALIPPVAWP